MASDGEYPLSIVEQAHLKKKKIEIDIQNIQTK